MAGYSQDQAISSLIERAPLYYGAEGLTLDWQFGRCWEYAWKNYGADKRRGFLRVRCAVYLSPGCRVPDTHDTMRSR